MVKQIMDRKTSPWFDGEYKSLRTCRRKAERTWRASGLTEDHQIYIKLRDKCTELANKKKTSFFKAQFQRYNYSPKSLYKFVDNFLDNDKSLILPPAENIKECVNDFNNFFQKKVLDIRKQFTDPPSFPVNNSFNGEELCAFELTTVDEISEILKQTEFKSSSVDPLPSSIFQENMELFLPTLCEIVNASLSSGSIDGLKLAHVKPLLKGRGLDSANLKNYRPISNLSFIGKLIERVVLKRLNAHLQKNNLDIPHQSGYKKGHSTETLLIRVVNDLLIASSEDKATVVMLLDLSAAFDTVDHTKLLNILKREVGISGIAWKWFKSFLTGRCQCIRVGDSESNYIYIMFGVPQGSVLGPILFNIYIRSLYSTVSNLKFAIHGFADDHQIYKNFSSPDQYMNLIKDIPDCLDQIKSWMDNHYLQLNPGKTEIIVFGTSKLLSEIKIHGTFLSNGVCVRFSPIVKSLGFRLDENLNFKKQISHVKSISFVKLRSIARMKQFLTNKQVEILIHAIVISLLDYCNSLYYGCDASSLRQLQSIQNRACRIIFGLKKQDDLSEKMQSLHWLKIKERIIFKTLLLVFKSVHGLAPSYINELICFNNDSNNRRKSLHISVATPSHPRAFQTFAPKLWHQLPNSVKSCSSVDVFKSLLKTYLYKQSYNLE